MQLLTVEEVARQLGRHEELVRRWLRTGKLRGERYGWSWLVRPADLERFQRDEPRRRNRDQRL